jgi:hypothetical protein
MLTMSCKDRYARRLFATCSSAAWPWRSSPGFWLSISSGRECPRDQPAEHKIESLRREAVSCQACPLWEGATQTVFGELRRTQRLCWLASSLGLGRP